MAETVGQRIERLAKEKGLPTGAVLAERCGVSYESFRKWKAGDAAPNRRRQEVIAQVLGVEPAAFMFGADGGTSGEPLQSDEARLLRAFRVVLTEDRADFLRQLERRAREVSELEMRLRADLAAGSSRKRTGTAG